VLTPRTSGLALAGLLVLTGCGPADKQAAVQAVRHAADTLGPRTGTVSLTITRDGGQPALTPHRTSLPAVAGVVLDPTHRSAALLAPPVMTKLRGQALAVFDRSVVYSRTADGNAVGARPWFRLDSAHLGALNHYGVQDLTRPTTLGDLVVLNPFTVVDDVRGLLTGSVQIDRNASVTAPGTGQRVPAVEYAGNTSLDKVARQLHVDPDRERPTRNLLGVYAITRDINPVSIWVSPAGALLRVRVSFVSTPLKRVTFRVVYDLTLDPPQAPSPDMAALQAPTRDEVVDVNSLGQLSLALTNLGQA